MTKKGSVGLIVKGGNDSQAGKHEPQKGTAHIPHEKFCSGKVEQHEAQGAGCDRIADNIGKLLPWV